MYYLKRSYGVHFTDLLIKRSAQVSSHEWNSDAETLRFTENSQGRCSFYPHHKHYRFCHSHYRLFLWNHTLLEWTHLFWIRNTSSRKYRIFLWDHTTTSWSVLMCHLCSQWCVKCTIIHNEFTMIFAVKCRSRKYLNIFRSCFESILQRYLVMGWLQHTSNGMNTLMGLLWEAHWVRWPQRLYGETFI